MRSPIIFALPIILSLLLSLLPIGAYAQSIAAVAVLESTEGVVELQKAGQPNFLTAQVGTSLYPNDSIKTGDNSRASIAFTEGGFLRLGPKTILQLQGATGDKSQTQLSMSTGKMYFFGREASQSPVVDTPSATTAVRGTEFYIEATRTRTEVAVLDGAVNLENIAGGVLLKSGENGTAELGKLPLKGLLLKPLNAVQWAIYYPSILSLRDLPDIFAPLSEAEGAAMMRAAKGDTQAPSVFNKDWKAFLAVALAQAANGQAAEAVSTLQNYSARVPVGYSLLQSGLYLSLGMVTEAKMLLENGKLSIGQPRTSADKRLLAAIEAQLAMVALSMNDKDEAARLVAKARFLAPGSATVKLTETYVAQANFQLEEAIYNIGLALRAEPDSGPSLAKLAELQMGFGEVEKALITASNAVLLAPHDSYVRTIAGFAQLMCKEPRRAKEIFNQVLSGDPAFALARFGLGLTKIKLGDLKAGQRDLEAAAFLAPNVSIYRSYLGKAYFEQYREKLADHEYQRAIELDPLDPTPFLYRAFNEVAHNDPVSALADVEHATTLNNNRAVYRSSLLLDQDAAFQSASLARVFNELGFKHPARVEALKSINRDYSNYAAHLLLADSFDTIFSNDAMRSEDRIASLLAPPTTNIVGRTEGEASFSEYDAMFDRPDSRTDLALVSSSYQDLVAPKVLHTERGEDYAFALSDEPHWLKGSKHGNFVRQNRFVGRGAYELSYNDRVQLGGAAAYYRDKTQLADPEAQRLERYDLNAGFFHRFGPSSNLIGDLAYGHDNNRAISPNAQRDAIMEEIFSGESTFSDDILNVNERIAERADLFRASIQHIYDSSAVSLVSGLELHRSDVHRAQKALVLDDSLAMFDGLNYTMLSAAKSDLNSSDLYSYATFHLPNADFTLGGTHSRVETENTTIAPFAEGTFTFERFNPKVGLMVYPAPDLMLKAAYFETLRKSVVDERASIEPVNVGGFAQLFNDIQPGSRAENAGLGFDYKIAASTYFGAEALHQNIEFSPSSNEALFINDYDNESGSFLVQTGEPIDFHQTQWLVNSYINQVFTKRWVGTLDYTFIKLDRTNSDFAQDMNLNKAAATIRYFDPSGFFPFARTTLRSQGRTGDDLAFPDGRDTFCLTDAGLGYRLPKRQGKIIFQVSNIFNQHFTYDQTFGVEPAFFEGVGVELLATFNF